MLDDKTKNQIEKLHSQWQHQTKKSKPLNKKFITVSGEEINPLYTPLDLEGIDFERDINFPGAFPYARGVHANMYRGKMWTMRQFSGMGNAAQTNERYHFLLNKGQEDVFPVTQFEKLWGYMTALPEIKSGFIVVPRQPYRKFMNFLSRNPPS